MRRNISRYPRRDWNAGEIIADAGRRYFRLITTGSGPLGGAASLTINVLGGAGNLHAPYYLHLRADNLQGFAVQDIAPDNLLYDPTQHEMQYVWFGLTDEEYVPTQTPNLPNLMRKPWESTGRQVAGCWMLPGTKDITVFAYDTAGNWASASISRTIGDEDSLYPGNLTICVSATSSSVGAPAGAQITTTLADAETRATAIRNNPDLAMRRPRILINRGETFAAPNWGFGNWGANAATVSLTIGAYGPALARPVLDYSAGTAFGVQAGGQIQFMNIGAATAPRHVIRDIEFRGPWRSWEEVGELRGPFGDNAGANIRNFIMITRCLFTGFNGVQLGGGAPDDATGGLVMFDCRVTNWTNYGVEFTHPRSAFIWCEFDQHPDALNGIGDQGTGNQTPTQLGNRHGPFRGGRTENYIKSCSFFSRNGWSNSAVMNYVNGPPTAMQAALRWNQIASLRRAYNNICDVACEGGLNVASFAGGVQATVPLPAAFNLHIDRILSVGNWGTGWELIGSGIPEVTIRNAYGWFPNTPLQHNGLLLRDFRFNSAQGTTWVHNATILNQLQASRLAVGYVPLLTEDGAVVVQENNAFRIAGRSIGAALEPLGTSPFAGFVCKDKGQRWNFRPAIHVVSTVREGGAGDVAVGERVLIPYPNHTGMNNGAGAQVTRAMVEQSTRKHVVSVTEGANSARQNMTSLAGGGNGRVSFAYSATHIIITNTGALVWPAAQSIWVLLDLTDRLMGFVPGTSTEGLVPPMPIPGVGSSARASATSGRVALTALNSDRRPGRLTNAGATVAGTASQGAFEA